MTKRVQRFGMTAGALASFTGLLREFIVNTTRNSIHVHDGVTVGGVETMRADGVNGALANGSAQGLLSAAGYNVINGIGSLPVPILQGGTGATTASAVRTNLGLGTAATQNTGTSGANIPLLNADNTYSGAINMSGKPINEAVTGSLAAATTTDLSTVLANSVYITGAAPVTITSWGNLPSGAKRYIRNASATNFTIQNNVNTNNITAADIVLAPNDGIIIRSIGTSSWIMDSLTRANGKAITETTQITKWTSATTTPAIVSAGGQLSVGHGLGQKPMMFEAYLRCVTTEGGYAVGDEVPYPRPLEAWNGSSNVFGGATVSADATNVNVVINNGLSTIGLGNKANGAAFNPTAANWATVFKAIL